MTLWFLLLLLLVSVHAAPDPACIAFHRHPRTVHSSDHCALALHSPKVALLFLTRGELPHEKLWRRWFEDLGSLAFSGCMVDRETDYFMKCTQERRADPISQQHLFSVQPCTALPWQRFSLQSQVKELCFEVCLCRPPAKVTCSSLSARAGVCAHRPRLPRLQTG